MLRVCHESEVRTLENNRLSAKREREKYRGFSYFEILATASNALGAGKTQQEWQEDIDFFDFDLSHEIWTQATRNRESRLKHEEAQQRRLREPALTPKTVSDDPAYQANLREYEESMARLERGESAPKPRRGRPGHRIPRVPSGHPVPATWSTPVG